MNFSKAEIEVLSLCAMCKDLPVDGCRNIPQETLSLLLYLGLIRPSKSNMGYRITPKGAEILKSADINFFQDKSYVSSSEILTRRMHTAEITSFFWKYGADVFNEVPPAENDKKIFLPSFTFRRQSAANFLGGSRLTGFYYTPTNIFVPYYIAKNQKGFYPNVEQRTFYAETISLKRKPYVIYAGKGSLENIIDSVTTHNPKSKKDTSVYYDDGIDEFVCPVAIMPLDENGMRQLRILETPNYKQRLIKRLLKERYLPPESEEFDGRDKFQNYVIGIDCNIKRFEGLTKLNKPIGLFVLPFQADIAEDIVEDTNVTCYVLNLSDAEAALGIKHELPKVDNTPYKTEKGEYLDVPLIGKIKDIRR